MLSSKKPNTTVGLDIETGSIAATEVRTNGSAGVSRTAMAPLPPGVVAEGEVQDAKALSEALKELFSKNKLGKAVRLGIANQSVVVRTMRMPLIEDPKELDTAIRFQAQEQIPMPLDQAVLDHQVIARENGPEGERQMDVVAVAARRDMVSSLLASLRAAGLRPTGIDLSAFGMIRALGFGDADPEEGAVQTTTLCCHLGDITNLAVARGSQCLFTRVAPFGLENIAAAVAERNDMDLDEAREWMVEVGLDEPIEEFGEDREEAIAARGKLAEGASTLADELRVSLDFYGAQEGMPPIERVVLCGPGSTIGGLPERIQSGLGLGIEVMSPQALEHLDREDAARLTVSYGLALDA
ncbi:MAG: type IV pilus assembly protein PilM [Solirubrobacterales bacterium]|nr:type IV pilus assembly protein PilM [Solirubrobacterales bacterium]